MWFGLDEDIVHKIKVALKKQEQLWEYPGLVFPIHGWGEIVL